MDREDDEYLSHYEDDETCPTCNGNGTVSPLTAPSGFFCVSISTCPACLGTGNTE